MNNAKSVLFQILALYQQRYILSTKMNDEETAKEVLDKVRLLQFLIRESFDSETAESIIKRAMNQDVRYE